MEDKLYLENIEEFVFDLDKIVTYKWLAMTLSVPFSEATRMISEFVQQYSATPSSKQPIHVIYLITGVSRDSDNEKIVVSLVDEDELEEIKSGLDEVYNIIIYSVQKGNHLKDRSTLHTAEHEVLQENLHNYSDLCSVKCTEPSIDQNSEVTGDSKTPSLPAEKKLDQHSKQDDKPVQQAKQDDKPVQQAKVGPLMNKKVSSNNSATKRPRGIAAMFASKQPKNATSNPDKPACKQEEETQKLSLKKWGKAIKGSSNNVKNMKKLTQSLTKISVGSIVNSKFDKDVFATEDDDDVDDVVVKKDEEPKRSVTSNPVTAQVNEQKGKNKKRRRVCQEFSSEESDEDAADTDKPSVRSVDQPAAGTKKRKIVRKLVNKMYIDDDGSMVTEKEWQEISTDDDDEPVVVTSNKTKTISSVKAKSKQSTLSSFFHRK